MNLVLIGFKRCGKTHFANLLSQQLGIPKIDSDDLMLEKFPQKTISEVYNSLGENDFRKAELDVIESLKTAKDCVISFGGGSVHEKTLPIIDEIGNAVYLLLSKEEVITKLCADPLPAFIDKNHPRESASEIYVRRAHHLNLAATWTLNPKTPSVLALLTKYYQETVGGK